MFYKVGTHLESLLPLIWLLYRFLEPAASPKVRLEARTSQKGLDEMPALEAGVWSSPVRPAESPAFRPSDNCRYVQLGSRPFLW